MTRQTARDLDLYWPELRRRLHETFTLFEAAAVDWGNGPVAYWPDPDDVDGFLTVAAVAGAGVVYAHATELDGIALAGLVATPRRREPHPDVADVLIEGEAFLGRTAVVEVAWMLDGMAHVLTIEADWYRRLQDRLRDLEVAEYMDAEADELLLSHRLERVPAWAEEVSRQEDFQRTRSVAERGEVVCRLVAELGQARERGEAGARIVIAEVAREAWRIFEEEIRPRQEREMAQIAHSLLMSGLKKYEVAARMGVGKERLNTLIARYPEPDS